MAAKEEQVEYRIVVAVGAESQLAPLLALGCALAASRKGQLTILNVTPTGQRPEWLDVPSTCDEVPIGVTIRAGENPATEVLDMVRHDPPDLLLLGWRGDARGASRGRYLAGRNLDRLVQSAPCDVIVLCINPDRPLLMEAGSKAKRILVPVAGGPNAALAIELALSLEAEVTVLTVARQVTGPQGMSLAEERLSEVLAPWKDESRLQGRVVQAPAIVQGILNEAAAGYDLVMIGASHESYLDRVLFGNIPQAVASHSPAPAAIVRHYTRRMQVGSWLRRTGWRLFDMLPTLETRQQIEVYKEIRNGVDPDIDFFLMIALSSAIATFGLVQNSPAVIIGAMLVAPLMVAIFGLSLGMVRGDLRLLRRATGAILRGVLLAIIVSLLFAILIPTLQPQGEIMARTAPTLLDLAVALAAGAAGAYALCRKEVSASLPGVAIAAALVPPLVTTGIGLALWLRGFSGAVEIAGGAVLLFMTNLVAISAAGALIFLWLGFRPIPGQQTRVRVFRGGVLTTALLVVVVTIPLGLLTAQSVRDATLKHEVDRAVRAEVGAMSYVELNEWQMLPPENGDDAIHLQVWVLSPRTVAHHEVVELQERLASRLQRTVKLQLSVIPTMYLDPLVPPASLPGSTASFTPSLSPTPMLTHNPTSMLPAAPTPSPTAE